MKNKILTMSLIAATALFSVSSFGEEIVLEDINVTSDLRQISQQEIAASVDVMNSIALQDKGATHFEDVILEVPNVNFSGQSSRPRHIQIRGMGERDEYTGAPNASVGFMIDGIDFSGVGMAGTLFDVKQVEVLKGSQSTRYGASAIAGLINIQSNDPTENQEGMLELTAGTKGLAEVGLVLSGPLGKEDNSPLYRLSVQKHKDNGFYENKYLNRDDTNGRDELSLRAKVHFRPTDDLSIDVTLMHANLDNGYDAWSLDNTFTTLSDEPGKDTQLTNAGAIKIKSTMNPYFTFISSTTLSNSDMQYAYDGDWTYLGYYPSDPSFRYVFDNEKEHKTFAQEFRFVSTEESRLFNDTTAWLVGLYGSKLEEKNHTTDNYGQDLKSDYDITKLAMFAQFDYDVSEKMLLSVGLRAENQEQEYNNNANETYTPSDTLYGGQISLTQKINDSMNVYGLISQGYKAGGFNVGVPSNKPELRQFENETALNYELGFKTKTETLTAAVSIFYTDRQNPQFDGYTYVGANYVYYKENLDKATNYGLEADFDWKANDNINIFGTLGLLKTTVKGQSKSGAFDIDGREQPHAPNYQYTLGTQYRADNGFYGRASVRGMDEFYFDTVHNAKSEAYTVVDARVGYEEESWEVYLWGRNLFDERYATRGYYFANEPTYSIEKQYIRLGDGRQIGLTGRYHF
ncbi:TonB-dependent receptor [hydrothermal vent metagenome]|uniref:TonB-dependent receptor n=1 Tax=hydrothermal vent metagenome TaxID=652676 RepID=A0A1W1ECD1_9ZZZZ